MSFLICAVPVCPVRADASHRSEQVSQLLFGERCEEVERTNDFVKIRVVYDQYEGWCQASQVEEVDDETASIENVNFSGDWVSEIVINNHPMRIPFGSSLPQNRLIGKYEFVHEGSLKGVEKKGLNAEQVKEIASVFLNTPYLWGGRSVFGIDCSGFTQLVFKFMNIPLLRDASQQVTQGDEVGFLQEVKGGDLAFFDNEAGRITHVGILLDSSTIIHASGKVRIDAIDSLGIINSDMGKRTHKLRLIKRINGEKKAGLF